jgi:hypothetical protein
MRCRVCKCTQERACGNGCGWAPGQGDLCTNCADIVKTLGNYVEVAYRFNVTGLLRELNEKRSGFVRRVRAAGGSR